MKVYSEKSSCSTLEYEYIRKNWPAVVVQLQNQLQTENCQKNQVEDSELIFSTMSSMLCCSGKTDCEKANHFTVEISQFADSKKVFKLLDQLCEKQNARMRAVLLDVNYDQDGALFQRIANSPDIVIEQLEYALDVGEYSRSGTLSFLLSKLIVKLICGSDVHPRNMPNEYLISHALAIISRMCLGSNVDPQCESHASDLNEVFSRSQTDYEFDHSPLNPFELYGESATIPGAIAILNLLYLANPTLTPEQFTRFIGNVVEIGPVEIKGGSNFSNITTINLRNRKLPSPPGWTDDMGSDGKIVPLLIMDSVIQECREHISDFPTNYSEAARVAACGAVALLALRFEKQRGILSLGMSGVMINGKNTTRFRVLDISGNVEDENTEQIANQLVDRLNKRQRPLELQDYPLTAENKFSALLAPNVHSAEELWSEYTKVLPKEFQSYSKLLSYYSAALHMLRDELDSAINKQVEALNSSPV